MSDTTVIQAELRTLHVYYGRLLSFKFVFQNGVEAIFQQSLMDEGVSVFRTDQEYQIKELDAEVKSGHPYIFIKKGEETITEDLVDPVEAYKRFIIQEYEMKKHQELADPNNDRGSYTPEQLKAAGTNKFGALAGAQQSGQDTPVKVVPTAA